MNFIFDSLIYNGFDNPQDGIGNHLALLDRLVFDDFPQGQKSLSPIPHAGSLAPYGRVSENQHLLTPDNFQRCLYLDVARETWDSELIRSQMRKTLDHKRVFGCPTAIYLMWESDKLWEQYAQMVECYDFCIVTCSILDEFLQARGIDVIKLQHPYDFEKLNSISKPTSSDVSFRFGVSSGLWSRKNAVLLAEEFLTAFESQPDVSLSIHTRSDVTHTDYEDEYRRLSELRDQSYQIQILAQPLSRPDYIEWMRTLDAYCFVSAGEGYSVTPREALHLKKPVVLHDAHAHREFAHLPGVLRVPSVGTKVATPNVAAKGYDIGSDWSVDRAALRESLIVCRESYNEIQRQLEERYSEVLDYHDPAKIKLEWVRALNQKFKKYSDSIHLSHPAAESTPYLRSMPSIPGPMRLSSPHFTQKTGQLIGQRVYCNQSRHKAGMCLLGPGSLVEKSGDLSVRFNIALLSAEQKSKTENSNPNSNSVVMRHAGWIKNVLRNVTGENSKPILRLSVYDHITKRELGMKSLSIDEFRSLEQEFDVIVPVQVEQKLDFRVYWHGTTDTCVSSVLVNYLD
ncbi:MAG: glycosyltransferase [Arenicella sp.]|nr:glycosyltransferase [Arenicella sp.]